MKRNYETPTLELVKMLDVVSTSGEVIDSEDVETETIPLNSAYNK